MFLINHARRILSTERESFGAHRRPRVLALLLNEREDAGRIADKVAEAVEGANRVANSHISTLAVLILRISDAQDRRGDSVRQSRLGASDFGRA